MSLDYGKPLRIQTTPIPGFLHIDLTVHQDSRGWFKENWQRAKMTGLGLPDIGIVQNNISFNDQVGVTRGIHAEPWDKYISVATGRVFGAWVDLRTGDSFGRVYTCEIDPSVAVFVPKGVGNAYQTLEPNTAYSYLVDAHWRPDAPYTFLNLADETVAIDWPIPLDRAIVSAKDKSHPRLADVTPVATSSAPGRRVLVTGAGGQLGRELLRQLPEAGFAPTAALRTDLDISDAAAVSGFDWSGYDIVINAAAWTDVDAAETPEGRRLAWKANAVGPANLARAVIDHDLTLVHISSEYVFDGMTTGGPDAPHDDDEPPSPLGVYGQSKAAGDAVAVAVPRHYVVRTSWIVGDGKNFVRTMSSLAHRGVPAAVVADQWGRLTFTTDLAAGIIHLLQHRPPPGIYNLTNEGPAMNWCQVAQRVFELSGGQRSQVRPISTEQYQQGKSAAPRPRWGMLSLAKLEAAGFIPADADRRLADYLT